MERCESYRRTCCTGSVSSECTIARPATALLAASGKIAAVIGPILAGALVGIGYLAALVPLAIAFAAGGIVVLAFGRETKGEPLT